MRANLFTPAILLILLLVVSTAPEAESATVSGRMLMKNGIPLAGGIAVAFDLQSEVPPAPERYFRPPDYGAEIKNDGSFQLLLPPGEYAIGAVKRKEGKTGPPREGDVYFMIKDEDHNLKRIAVPANGDVALGNLAQGEIFKPVMDPTPPVTSVIGRVTDTQGNPVPGIVVAAVLSKQGMENILFYAQDTDSNGTYKLHLPFGGTYNLGIWGESSPGDAAKDFTRSLRIDTGDTLPGFDLQLPRMK